jgi:hypothetical protein
MLVLMLMLMLVLVAAAGLELASGSLIPLAHVAARP